MHAVKIFAAIIVSLLLTTGCEQATQQPAENLGDIANTELQQRIDNGSAPLILDVRSADEFAAGHLPGAINIPHDEVGARLNELSATQDAEIVIHCKSGRRAGMATETLQAAGFSSIRHLDGDYDGWTAAGLPLAE